MTHNVNNHPAVEERHIKNYAAALVFAVVADAEPFMLKSPATDNADEGMVLVPLPLRISVEYPAVEPLGLTTVWEAPLYSTVLVLLAAFKTPVDDNERVPAILITLLVPRISVAPFATVTLLKLVGSDMVAAEFVNTIVLVPALKVPLLFHAPVFPAIVSEVDVPPFSIPPD